MVDLTHPQRFFPLQYNLCGIPSQTHPKVCILNVSKYNQVAYLFHETSSCHSNQVLLCLYTMLFMRFCCALSRACYACLWPMYLDSCLLLSTAEPNAPWGRFPLPFPFDPSRLDKMRQIKSDHCITGPSTPPKKMLL